MKKSSLDLNIPQRQPIAALGVIFYKSFEDLIKGFWPIILIALMNGKGSRTNYFLIIGSIGFALMSFVFGIVRYYRFQYHVEEENFIIEKGLFTRSKVSLPFSRIQSIRLEQPFMHRILNLYNLQIDSAGSAQNEIQIPALHKDQAEQLKSILLKKREEYISGDALLTNDTAAGIQVEYRKEIMHLSIPDILKISMTANHIKNIFVLMGLAAGMYFQFGEIVLGEDQITDQLYHYLKSATKDGFLYGVLFVAPIMFIATVLTSLIIYTYKYYNLKLSETGAGYELKSGLINLKEQFAPFEKTQIIKWDMPFLRRIYGFYNLSLRQASSNTTNVSQVLMIPGSKAKAVNSLLDNLFSESITDRLLSFKINPVLSIRYTLYFGVLPAIGLIIASYFTELYYLTPIAVLFILLSYLWYKNYAKTWRLLLGQDYIQLQYGVFRKKYQRIFLHKVQGVNLSKTPYQVRNDLSSLTIYTAAGDVTIPYLNDIDAEMISDYILFQLESSDKPWM